MPTDKIKNIGGRKMDDIIRSAIKEFATHNFHDSSYNRIIQNAGMSKGTMYYYFKSKEDLFLTIVHGTINGLKSMLSPLPEPCTAEEYWPLVEGLVQRFFKFANAQPMVFKFTLQNLIKTDRNCDSPAKTTFAQADEWLEHFLIAGQKFRVVRDDLPISLLKAMIWGTIDLTSKWLIKGNQNAEYEEAALLTDLLRRSVFPQEIRESEQLLTS